MRVAGERRCVAAARQRRESRWPPPRMEKSSRKTPGARRCRAQTRRRRLHQQQRGRDCWRCCQMMSCCWLVLPPCSALHAHRASRESAVRGRGSAGSLSEAFLEENWRGVGARCCLAMLFGCGGGGTTSFTTKLQSVRRRHQEMPPTLSFDERKNNHPPPSRRTNTGAPRYEAPAPDSSRTSRWWVLLSRYALCAAAGVRVQSDRRAGRRATAAGRRPRISRGPWGRPQELRRRTTRRRSCASARCRCASAPRRRGGRSGRRGRSSSRRRRACASA